MKQKLIAVASAAMIGLTAVAIPSKVEEVAAWRLGAAIASRPYYYGPGYYGYAYDPYYYDYGPSYYGGGPYYYARPYRYYRRPYRHWTEF